MFCFNYFFIEIKSSKISYKSSIDISKSNAVFILFKIEFIVKPILSFFNDKIIHNKFSCENNTEFFNDTKIKLLVKLNYF